jgi:hypothetical protein
MELMDWTMRIYVQDRRCKAGERILKTYAYQNKHLQWMREEVRDLQAGLYPAPKFRFEVDPTFVTVINLMDGEPVRIRAEDRGGPCDPSMESFWQI